MLRNILARSRFLVIIAVIGTFLASAAILIDAGLAVVNIVFETFAQRTFTIEVIKHVAVEFIESIDLFLLGTVLYIISLGLYELFIDDLLPMPRWLVISSFDDLKERLLGIVIVLLAVSFLGFVVAWDGNTNILALGVAVGLVLLALSVLLGVSAYAKAQQEAQTQPNEVKDQAKAERSEEQLVTIRQEHITAHEDHSRPGN